MLMIAGDHAGGCKEVALGTWRYLDVAGCSWMFPSIPKALSIAKKNQTDDQSRILQTVRRPHAYVLQESK
jgi:hypothetical protein